MSDTRNVAFFEHVAEKIDIANDLAEYWTGTLHETVLLSHVQAITRLLDAGDYESVHEDMLLALDRAILQAANEMDAQAHFHNYDLLPEENDV